MTTPPLSAEQDLLVAEPTAPGTSQQYLKGRPLRRFTLWFTLATGSLTAIWASVGAILLPNQVQSIQFGTWFTGHDSSVNLQQLTTLKAAIAAGTAQATPDQVRLLGLLSQFDASRASSLALIAAVGVIVTMVAQPIVGVLSDRTRSRFGRRGPWILLGAVVGSAFLIGVRFAPSIAILMVLWTGAQLFLNFASGPITTTVADRIPESKRGAVSGMGGLAQFGGGVLGGVAAGALFGTLGVNLYFVFAVIAAACLIAFVLLVRDRSSVDLERSDFRWGQFFAGFLVPLRAADFRWVWVARVLLTFGYAVSTALTFFMLQSYVRPALSQAQATALVPLITVVGAPFTLLAVVVAGRLSDRFKRRKPFVIVASLLMALSMTIPLMSPTVTGLLINAAVTGLAFGTFLPVDQALFVDVLPDRINAAGRDLGVAALGSNLGQALGPILAAQIVAITASYQLVWAAAAVLVAIAAFAIIPVKTAR